MWEFEVENVYNGERFFIWGYDFEDACIRHNLNSDDLDIIFQEYID